MRDHPHELAQDKIGQAIGRVTADQVRQPLPIARVIDRVLAMRVDEDVNVDQDHWALP